AAKNLKTDKDVALKLPSDRWGSDSADNSGEYKYDIQALGRPQDRPVDINQTIERHDKRAVTSMLAYVLLMGQQQVGTYAQSVVGMDLLTAAVESYVEGIYERRNRFLVPRIFAMNPSFRVKSYPRLVPGRVSLPSLGELGSFIRDTVSSKALTPTLDIENLLRDALKTVRLSDEERESEQEQARRREEAEARQTDPEEMP
ncbi:MAG TPA: hypothetical protein VLV83_07515, partial [Acidobacteriota bacterium]|nr:hypothetical protein [Acidobacteriota bacterium]